VGFGRLIRQTLTSELGEKNVVRIDYGPSTDSEGQAALHITVVIAPGAAERLKNGIALDALVRLRERFREIGEERTPLVHYATEAELQQDGVA
jgi:hypothetical protein